MAEKVIWTATARHDLHAIALEIAKDRPAVAERYCTELIDRADAIGDFPRMGRKLPELDNENVREIIHVPYRVIYELFPDQPPPVIMRVWHSTRGTPDIRQTNP